MNLESIATITFSLFAIIDMPGNIPLIIRLRKENGEIESAKASLYAIGIMIFMLFAGKYVLMAFGIEIHYFAIVGALILVYYGILMLFDLGSGSGGSDKPAPNVSVFPLAFPLIAGPGALSTIMTFRVEYQVIDILVGILINAIIIFAVLKSAGWINKKIGNSGIGIIERVFGFILGSIGLKMLFTNVYIAIEALS